MPSNVSVVKSSPCRRMLARAGAPRKRGNAATVARVRAVAAFPRSRVSRGSYFFASTMGASSLARTRPKKSRTDLYCSAGMVVASWMSLRV